MWKGERVGIGTLAHEDPAERKRMVDVFKRQAKLAAARGLPLVVHTRDAEEDTLVVFREPVRACDRCTVSAINFPGGLSTSLSLHSARRLPLPRSLAPQAAEL